MVRIRQREIIPGGTPVSKQYEYDAVIRELPEKGGAYVAFPWNIREEFGKGDGDTVHMVIVERG